MSQCFKLINGGFVDKVIVFDSLPERLYKSVRTRACEGFPRAWAKWLGEIGSVRNTYKTTTEKRGPGDYAFHHEVIGTEPCFYVLEYTDINSDKEAWRQIGEFLRMNCDETVRLKEKVEDMAMALARNATDPLSVEPEDIPVINIPKEEKVEAKIKSEDVVKHGEVLLVEDVVTPTKRKGRPKKVTVEA